jgi:pyruvate carboxylase
VCRNPSARHPFPSAPPSGTRQLLLELGPEKFAQWVRDQKRLLLTDTTFRDAHQSLMATRVRTYDLLAIANHVAHRNPELFSVEMWGGATFDVCLRFLHEDPWQRLAQLREAIPNICFQMLLRASNAVGYTAYPDNVVREFVLESSAQGIDIFRIFDSLNWLPNMKVAMEAARETRSICEAAICYTGDILDPKRDKYPLEYYVRLAKELEKMGAHILAIKDMAGLCKPFAARKLVKALREEVGIPIHFHTHDTSSAGIASMLMASEEGVDIVDAAISSMSGTTSQPNLDSIVAALQNTPRDTGLDLAALQLSANYWERVREWYEPFDSGLKTGTAEVYLHEMPGGQFTNLKEQAKAMGLGDKWPLVAQTYADVNMLFGDIVKVTPSSKVVGDMALFLVSHGMTVNEFARLDEHHNLTLPNSVIDMFRGSLGEPDGGWPEKVRKMILKGEEPLKGRPGAELPPADFEATQKTIEEKTGRPASRTDVLSYLLYPEVYLNFAKTVQKYSNLDVLPTPEFFYGMKPGEEITIELEAGKSLVVKLLTVGEPHKEGHRTIFFELNGQPREVDVRDQTLEVRQEQRPKADQNNLGHVGAPIPGMVSSMAVELNQTVEKGDKLLVMEAMKMQTTVYAPVSGKVLERHVSVGDQVEAKDLMLVIG